MKCKVCKRKCRDDGWCNNCGRYTTESGEALPQRGMKYYNYQGRDHKREEFAKQVRWLMHKVDTAGTEDKKSKEFGKLKDWWSKNEYWIKTQPPVMEEVRAWKKKTGLNL